ncbi:hypothetical protein ACQP2E_28175 [Actinoplanes sp. CA-015351]|uniref:hypothetical protein n=1 Tax=Actinoplanes sp. CA-015351 TaxID=3239897 RepID=UPI003D9770AC
MSADFDVPADRGSGRARPNEPAEYLGTTRVNGLAVQRWRTRAGIIALVWNAYDGPPTSDAELGEKLRAVGVGAALRAMPHFGVGGPALHQVSIPGVADAPEVAWDQLAEALGQPLPYWPIPLQQRRLIDAWQPGRPTVQALAVDPEMDLDVLLRLAALYDCDHPAAQVLSRLFRTVTWRESQAAAQMIAMAESMTFDGTIVIAARPIPVPRAHPDELPETVRRAGWLEILGRADVLADACVEQLVRWDGGRDCPFGAPVDLAPGDPISDEVIDRLEPTARTAAFRFLDAPPDAETLVDPATDAPAIRVADEDGQRIRIAVSQWLPTTSPLAELVLDDPIWIRTADGTVYPAPQDPRWGLGWGYAGNGPGALALLIHRLLDDITARAADDTRGAPEGLERLLSTDLPRGTRLSRSQLEAARASS